MKLKERRNCVLVRKCDLPTDYVKWFKKYIIVSRKIFQKHPHVEIAESVASSNPNSPKMCKIRCMNGSVYILCI